MLSSLQSTNSSDVARAPNGPVHLITGTMGQHGGISRYCQELYRGLQGQVPVQLCSFRVPPLTRRLTFFEHLPLGITPDEGRGVYHFTRIMGCSLMLWRPVRPAVATVHDLGPLVWPQEYRETSLLARSFFRLSLLGLKRMDWIIADSLATSRSLTTLLGFPSDRLAVVPLGVDNRFFCPVPRARKVLESAFGIPDRDGAFNILYVGTEAPRKNLGTLLKALAILKQAGSPVRLIKVGGAGQPRYRAAFQQQVEALGLSECVVLVGEVAEADLPLFYSAADAFVLPSYVEGFGLPVLEAMACGTPVVCSNAGALAEVVGGAGVLVEPGDARGFAAEIAALLRDAHFRERLAEMGLQRSQRFSWGQMAEETLAVYNRVLHQEVRREDGDGGSR